MFPDSAAHANMIEFLSIFLCMSTHQCLLGGYHLLGISIGQGYPPFFCLSDIILLLLFFNM
jgi:hypothetical protein